MLERAFAPPKTPESSPKLRTRELHRLSLASGAGSDVHSAISLQEVPKSPIGGTLDPIWEKVREAKAKRLAVLPSKVKSLEAIHEHPSAELFEPRLDALPKLVEREEEREEREEREELKSIIPQDLDKRAKPESRYVRIAKNDQQTFLMSSRVSFRESEDGTQVSQSSSIPSIFVLTGDAGNSDHRDGWGQT